MHKAAVCTEDLESGKRRKPSELEFPQLQDMP